MITIKGTLEELEQVFCAIKRSNWCVFGLSDCDQYGGCFECIWNKIEWEVIDGDKL